MVKFILPLAGSSELFINAGYVYPKSLIEIKGSPMIQHVTENIGKLSVAHNFIFIIKEDEASKYHLDNTLKLLSPGCEIVKLKRNTQGGLCSVLMAIENIDDNDSIIILNGDQVIDMNYNDVYQFWIDKHADAGIVTFTSVHPRWSYAYTEKDQVIQTAEKNPISRNAIAGYYFFAHAASFFENAFEVIRNQVHVNGNYYISPVLNEYVLRNKNVLHYPIKAEQYHSFYSPQMVNKFEKLAYNSNE